jgi:O-antigen/teichoic acid export membrane protein
MAVFIGCFLINVPVGVVQRIQRGYQEGFANNIWQVVGSLLGLVGVLVAILLRAGLPWLVFAMAGSPVLTTILNGIVLFGFQRPWLCPQISGFTVGAARRILSTGLLFFALQVATAIGYQSDNIVLARILGADAVVHYAVPLKLFSFVPVVLGFVLMPLWPAYGESIARGDVIWVRKTLIGSLAISLLIDIPIVSFLVVFGRPLVHLWVGPDVTPSPLLLVGLGAWSLLAGLGGPLAMFLNGLEVMGFQTVCAMLMGLSNIVISVFLVRRIGVSGVIYGSIIAQILFILLPSAFYVPRLLSSVQSRNSSGDPGT